MKRLFICCGYHLSLVTVIPHIHAPPARHTFPQMQKVSGTVQWPARAPEVVQARADGGCSSFGCAFRCHSAPPAHFTAEDLPFCCSLCRTSSGMKHGGKCEKVPRSQGQGAEESAASEAKLQADEGAESAAAAAAAAAAATAAAAAEAAAAAAAVDLNTWAEVIPSDKTKPDALSTSTHNARARTFLGEMAQQRGGRGAVT